MHQSTCGEQEPRVLKSTEVNELCDTHYVIKLNLHHTGVGRWEWRGGGGSAECNALVFLLIFVFSFSFHLLSLLVAYYRVFAD